MLHSVCEWWYKQEKRHLRNLVLRDAEQSLWEDEVILLPAASISISIAEEKLVPRVV